MATEPETSIVSDRKREAFLRDGFVALRRFVTMREVHALRAIYDKAFEDAMGVSLEGMASAVRRADVPLLVLYAPPKVERVLKSTDVLKRAVSTAARLFGAPKSRIRVGWRFFSKPAGYPSTKWHQDAAYRPEPHDTLSFWVPLDPVNEQTSCLFYIPGSHADRKIRHHETEGDHLHTEDVDERLEVPCPVPVTGAVVHHTCVVHRAGPNATPAPRRAIGIVCMLG